VFFLWTNYIQLCVIPPWGQTLLQCGLLQVLCLDTSVVWWAHQVHFIASLRLGCGEVRKRHCDDGGCIPNYNPICKDSGKTKSRYVESPAYGVYLSRELGEHDGGVDKGINRLGLCAEGQYRAPGRSKDRKFEGGSSGNKRFKKPK
jgi:hypothetical protein